MTGILETTETSVHGAIGSLSGKTDPGSLSQAYAYDAASRLTTSIQGRAATTYSYSPAGELLQENPGIPTLYEYDGESRLTKVVEGSVSETTSQHVYFGDGLRRDTADAQTGLTRIVWDGSDYLQARTAPNAWAAGCASHSVPLTMAAGSTSSVSVTMRNNGTATWTAGASFRLGSQAGQDNARWGLQRVDLGPGDSVAPGQEKTFAFTITAPTTPGSYALQWRMLIEFVAWFGAFGPMTFVEVV